MRTAVSEERLIVISDLHLGNPLVRAGRPFRNLLAYALEHGYSVCINGDGVDIVQMSLSRLTRELWEAFALVKRFPEAGLRVYHTVGNHDIVLEHFLQDWGGISVIPFLNVQSGDKRIRIEHGHMYDHFFLTYPRIYTGTTVIGRWAMLLSPTTFHFLNKWLIRALRIPERMVGLVRGKRNALDGEGIPGERSGFRASAYEIAQRGFDAVVFGHTHFAGQTVLPDGALYFNTGFWMLQPCCLVIDNGQFWFGPVDELLRSPDPARDAAEDQNSAPQPAAPAVSLTV